MNKQKLRRIYKQKRAALSFEEIRELQENMYQQVYDLDISAVKNVHFFLSIELLKEIDTAPLIAYFRAKNKRIVVSKCNFKDSSLTHFFLEENSILELNKFGVLEPIDGEQTYEPVLDMIFIPLLISDAKKYRVGYGKGFYDRFLLKCREDAKLIGLNFFTPIQEIEDIDDFDIPLHQVIYPL
jgi:5-formyltetrahydrofolate cyclo-ligase